MDKDLKKKILITSELANSEVGSFFKNLDFELESVYSEGSNYQFCVNNACPEVKNIPRLQIIEDINADLQPMVFGQINDVMFYNEEGRELLTSYFHDAVEFDLVDRYSKEMSNIYSIKIHEFLNIGYFVDSIIIEAYKAKFDISALRTYLNLVISFSFKKVESSLYRVPVDVSYSHNGEAFAVQVSLPCDEWIGRSEMQNCIDEITQTTNYFDATYFKKTDRLSLSALIFKNPESRPAKASFFTEVLRRSSEAEIKRTGASSIYSGLVFNEPVRYQVTKQFIVDPAMKLFVARKFAHFIKNYRKSESSPIPLLKLKIDDILDYLTHYPKQKDLEDIDSEVKHFIFKLLKNSDFANDVDEFVEQVMDASPYAVVREIHKIMGNRGLDDVEAIIAEQQPDKLEESFHIRDNNTSDINSGLDFQRVRGSGRGNISNNEIWGVTSGPRDENDDNKKWEIKDLSHLDEFNSNSDKEKLEADLAQQFLDYQASSDSNKVKLESQVERLKKIMYQLKKEVIRLQNEKNLYDESGRSKLENEAQNVFGMVSNSEKTFEIIKNKDFVIEKMKDNFDQFIQRKDGVIKELEQKISSMEIDQSLHNDIFNNEKVDMLENENKALKFKLQLANKKFGVVSEKMEKRVVEVIGKRVKEIEALKGDLRLANAVIEQLKNETNVVENYDSIDREQFKKSREDLVLRKNIDEKNEIIERLSTEKKDMEEKLKIQHIELKKAEQKLKYTISQLESANKKKPTPNNPGLKSPEAYVKQLDLASSRMAEVTAEVIDKRREVVKMKQENYMLLLKIGELEKKMTNLEKKVA